MPGSVFQPSFFEREDESSDERFYAEARLVVHIDDQAIEAARQLYAELLPPGGAVLDLMSSWRSHLPETHVPRRVVGLGMNDAEMRANPQLSEHVVHDLNRDPRLPFAAREFDAAVVSVSVQYLTQPVAVFREVRRVLRDGAPFVVTYSNRMFPTKAVRVWRALDDRERAVLVRAYFREAGGWGPVTAEDRSTDGGDGDPLFAVWACRAADPTAIGEAADTV